MYVYCLQVTCIVTKKQTLAHMEKYMERWMKVRSQLTLISKIDHKSEI